MRIAIVIVCLIATCGFGYLAMTNFSVGSGVAFVASIAALLTAINNARKNPKKGISITQKVGNGSFGIQAGNDVNINKSKD